MKREKKRFSGLKKNLGSVFFFLGVLAISFSAANLFAATTPQKDNSQSLTPQKPKETYIQQLEPAPGEEELDILHIYDLVPPNKSLLTSAQFKVIDDFNSGQLKNLLGGTWEVENGKNKKTKLELNKEDARSMHRGYSLAAGFNLKKQEQLTFRSSLSRLDMSAAHFFALKCQVRSTTAASFDGRVRVAVTDWMGKTVVRDITEACRENSGWNNVVLPISFFKGIDLDQLDRISFSVLAREKPIAGKLSLDEIVFFGGPEVGFESTLDNLKGFPHVALDARRRQELLKTKDDKEFLLKIAQDTWRYFENAVNAEHFLVVDHVKTGDFPLVATYTSPTNIAMDLMGAVAAMELGLITRAQAEAKIKAVLKTLREVKRWKGFFYNFYETTKLAVGREFVSSVDNGWLAVAFVVLRQAFPGEIAEEATRFLDEFHFQEFLDPENNHLMIGYDCVRNSFTPYHYGMLVTEARAMSFYGIGKGDLPREHWWYLYRTAPEVWEWQNQKPQGKWVERDKVNYFQGYYKDGSKKFVPSWGGSLFEFLMPTLVLKERELGEKGLGLNNKIATELHRHYALKEKKYPVWGISPAAITNGRSWQYGEFGVKKLGVKGYPDKGIITPHVSFLALDALPQDAIKNIRKLLNYDIYGEYGFYDSVNTRNNQVNQQYLALDQGMTLVAIANYLKNGIIQQYFHQDPVAKKAEDLLSSEDFFKK